MNDIPPAHIAPIILWPILVLILALIICVVVFFVWIAICASQKRRAAKALPKTRIRMYINDADEIRYAAEYSCATGWVPIGDYNNERTAETSILMFLEGQKARQLRAQRTKIIEFPRK